MAELVAALRQAEGDLAAIIAASSDSDPAVPATTDGGMAALMAALIEETGVEVRYACGDGLAAATQAVAAATRAVAVAAQRSAEVAAALEAFYQAEKATYYTEQAAAQALDAAWAQLGLGAPPR